LTLDNCPTAFAVDNKVHGSDLPLKNDAITGPPLMS